MEIFALLMVIACLPAAVAKGKGHSFFGFWFYGVLVFPVALIHALVMRESDEGIARQKTASGRCKCPHCDEWISGEAKVCYHCGRDLKPTWNDLRVTPLHRVGRPDA